MLHAKKPRTDKKSKPENVETRHPKILKLSTLALRSFLAPAGRAAITKGSHPPWLAPNVSWISTQEGGFQGTLGFRVVFGIYI